MGYFDRISKKDKPSSAEMMVLTSVMASQILLEEEKISKGAVFEVLIFCALHILIKVKERIPKIYNDFEDEFFGEIYKFAREEGVLEQIPGDFTDFVDGRIHLYADQLNSLSDSESGYFIPTKIAYNFFENPLAVDSGDSFDLAEIMLLIGKFKYVFETLDKGIEMIFEKVPHFSRNGEYDYSDNKERSKHARLIIPSVGIDGVYINKTNCEEIKAKYGNEYYLINHNNFASEMRYDRIGISFFFKIEDCNKIIYFIQVRKEFGAYTDKGITFDKDLTIYDVVVAYGKKNNFSTSNSADYAFLDYGGIKFFVSKDDAVSSPAEIINVTAIGIG